MVSEVKVADEVWLAAASLHRRHPASVPGIDMFITNDHRLSRQVVPGIHFVQSFANAAL